MAKKKTPPSPTLPPKGGREIMEEGYSTGEWAGHTHYACALCAFDVLDDETVMLQHLAEAHKFILDLTPDPFPTGKGSLVGGEDEVIVLIEKAEAPAADKTGKTFISPEEVENAKNRFD